MIFNLVNIIPWGSDLPADKRIVRTLIIGCVCYVLLYSLISMNQFIQNQSIILILNMIRKFFWGVFAVDLSLLYILNKNDFSFSMIKNKLLTGLFGEKKEQKLLPQAENPPQVLAKKQETVVNHQPNQHEKSEKKIQGDDKDELDIDLLTEEFVESEVKKEVSSASPVEIPVESKPHDDTKQEKETSAPSDKTGNKDENISDGPIISNNEEQCEKKPDCPKLTQDNINKYVKNKTKIHLHTSIKSEDLNL